MEEFGVEAVEVAETTDEDVIQSELHGHGFGRAFQAPFGGLTVALVIYALAWGLVNFGFIVWLPIMLSARGLAAAQVTSVLASAALFAALPRELLATDMRLAIDALGEITGETTTDDILDVVFSAFCIGK